MRRTTSPRKLTRTLAVFLLFVAVAGSSRAGDLETDGAFASTRTDGPPLAASSTDVVSGLNAPKLDGISAWWLPRSPENIITVGTSGGDFSSVAAAVDSIGDASASNPYLIRIGPGIFVESNSVDLPGHIHLQGSGEDRTSVRAFFQVFSGPTRLTDLTIDQGRSSLRAMSVGNGARLLLRDARVLHPFRAISLTGGSVLELRDTDVTVTSEASELALEISSGSVSIVDSSILISQDSSSTSPTTPPPLVAAVHARGSSSPVTIERSSIVASSDCCATAGISHANGAELSIRDSTVFAHNFDSGELGQGIALELPDRAEISRSSVEVTGKEAVALDVTTDGGVPSSTPVRIVGVRAETSAPISSPKNIGLEHDGEGVEVFHSEILASSVTVSTPSGTTRISHTQLDGGGVGGAGTTVCRWMTNGNFDTFNTSCP